METLIEIRKRRSGDADIFEFHGELDETNADKAFGKIYADIGEFAGKKVLFNFSGLTYLNSKSLGYLADIYSNVEQGGGKMCVTNCLPEVNDTLELVGITNIISSFPTEKEGSDWLAKKQ